MATARKRALKIASNAPLAVRLAKSAIYQSYDLGLDAALTLAATYQGIVQNTPDHDEGVAALMEGRPPRFEGR
jgi:enoyl-CoA hydratase/carnithine racemase